MTNEEQPTVVIETETEAPRRRMRGTAIAWGIILLVVAAVAWFASTVGFAGLSPALVAWNLIAIGGLLVVIAIVAAIVRAVSSR